MSSVNQSGGIASAQSGNDKGEDNAASPNTQLLGPLIRMRALSPSSLPAHPLLSSLQTSSAPPTIEAFVGSALAEAQTFMKSYLPQNFQIKGASKPSPPSTAHVELLAHEIRARDLPTGVQGPDEAWFARSSVHENAPSDGTASWEEFDGGLRVDHSKHEMDYTPGVQAAHEVLNWGEQLAAIGQKVDEWSEITLQMMEMVHKLPTPLNGRVFSVVVLTAKRDQEFIDVQMPVDTTSVEQAKYNNAPKVTAGMYCSIDHGELIEAGSKVKWRMATASDAKGALPMWAQKMGVPGAVVKDVGLFIGWCEKRRKGEA